MRLKNWPAVGLIALALVTCLLVVLAFRHVRPTEVTPASPAAVPSSQAPTEQPPGTATPSGQASAAPPRTAIPTGSAAAGGGLQAVQTAFSGTDPVRMLVLGDESGDGADEWVGLVAQGLSDDHTTKYAGWDATANRFARATSSGSGSEVSIFNASREGATLSDAVANFDSRHQAMSSSSSASPKPVEQNPTDVVVVSFGYREPAGQFAQNLKKLSTKLGPNTPVLVVNQAPQKGAQANVQRDRARAATDWAAQSGYGAADVFAAFIAAPEPLAQLLDAQGVLPNAKGHQVWAKAVTDRIAAQ